MMSIVQTLAGTEEGAGTDRKIQKTLQTPKTPKASRKQMLKQDARYWKSEKLIQQALHQGLTNRQINMKAGDICRLATITRPTFYAHCRDSNDALRKYEVRLQANFNNRLPQARCKHDTVFTILLTFVYDKRGYFRATIPNSNFWLLNTFFDDIRSRLVSKNIGDRTYEYYVRTQIVIINDWVEFGKFAKNAIPKYVHKLMQTRLVDPSM